MQTVDGGVPEHEPTVRYDAFGDSGITFTVGLRTSEATLKGTVIHEFIKRAHRRFQAEGIDMPFPTVTLTHASVADGASGADGRDAEAQDLVSAGARGCELD
jgi:small-conductance mechanosensitive channel